MNIYSLRKSCFNLRQIILKHTEDILKCRNLCTSLNNLQDEKQGSNIILEKDKNITLIGINRETTRNSVDTATALELSRALQTFEEDDGSPVAVLYGVGGSFSSGYDLQEFEKEVEQSNLNFLMKREGAVGPTRRHLRKPVICGINGFCVASGLELALMCDLRIMEESAVLGFFNRHFGVPISDGGTARLAHFVGYSRALDLITTGRRVTAKEALSMGLVNRLVAVGTALGQAVHLAFSIAKFPQTSLRHDRSALYTNAYERITFRQATENEIMYSSKELLQEMREPVRKFSEPDTKVALMDCWNRHRSIPEWEKDEIAREEAIIKAKKKKNMSA